MWPALTLRTTTNSIIKFQIKVQMPYRGYKLIFNHVIQFLKLLEAFLLQMAL